MTFLRNRKAKIRAESDADGLLRIPHATHAVTDQRCRHNVTSDYCSASPFARCTSAINDYGLSTSLAVSRLFSLIGDRWNDERGLLYTPDYRRCRLLSAVDRCALSKPW